MTTFRLLLLIFILPAVAIPSPLLGNSLNDPNRQVRIQVLEWAEDGTPLFGELVPDGPHVITGTPPEPANSQ